VGSSLLLLTKMTIELKLLILLTVANGAPIIAKKFMGSRFSLPIDLNIILADGQPLLGPAKTWRGWLVAVAATGVAAPLLGISWTTGVVFGAAAMAGDLLSSFIKRRMKYPTSSMALAIDQIPEAVVPCLVLKSALALDWFNIGIIVGVFFIGELLVSRLLFKLHIRDRPY